MFNKSLCDIYCDHVYAGLECVCCAVKLETGVNIVWLYEPKLVVGMIRRQCSKILILKLPTELCFQNIRIMYTYT